MGSEFDVILETEINVFEVTVEVGFLGPQGVPVETTLNYTAGVNVSGHHAVTYDTTGKAVYASNTELLHMGKILGITNNAALIGDSVVVRKYGYIDEPSWSWDTDKPVYLGENGALTQVVPEQPLSKFILVLGYPVTPTKLFVNIGTPITLI